ncbi:hypothetical protein AAFF_G00147210 [Aldrovandia affinis]|uniref:Uncharacterized protein n=1 Tax=Aldrovandia affinis TaxID=143900 RepID=A0AAD7RPM5_9TELE|nr:hypothetical protein AAFF_G00147210 [Aldrovandia affinis]
MRNNTELNHIHFALSAGGGQSDTLVFLSVAVAKNTLAQADSCRNEDERPLTHDARSPRRDCVPATCSGRADLYVNLASYCGSGGFFGEKDGETAAFLAPLLRRR